MRHNEQFNTQDMGLAVALVCKDFALQDLGPSAGGSRYTFHFEATPGIDEAAQEYWNGKLTVDAKQFWNESKNLKTRLYSLR